MKAAEARKLIGKEVTWLDSWCPKNGFMVREGTILEVRGKNVRVDQQGSEDWKWLPDMRQMKEKALAAQDSAGCERLAKS